MKGINQSVQPNNTDGRLQKEYSNAVNFPLYLFMLAAYACWMLDKELVEEEIEPERFLG